MDRNLPLYRMVWHRAIEGVRISNQRYMLRTLQNTNRDNYNTIKHYQKSPHKLERTTSVKIYEKTTSIEIYKT